LGDHRDLELAERIPLNIISNDDRVADRCWHDLADVVKQPTTPAVRSAPALRSGSIPQPSHPPGWELSAMPAANILRGPGTFNIDFSAHKVFTLRERLRLQYRAESSTC